jgi:hypothetical protein
MARLAASTVTAGINCKVFYPYNSYIGYKFTSAAHHTGIEYQNKTKIALSKLPSAKKQAKLGDFWYRNHHDHGVCL